MDLQQPWTKTTTIRPNQPSDRSVQHEIAQRGLRRLAAVTAVGMLLAGTLGAEEYPQSNTPKENNTHQVGQWLAFTASPLAILVSAIGSWAMASRAINSNREIARNRATFDYLSRLSWDHDYIQKKEIFLEIRASDKKMSSVATEYEELKVNSKSSALTHDEKAKILSKHSAIRTVLNEYEAIAVGVFTGTLSEEIVARNHRQAIIDHVTACEEFIEITRQNAKVRQPKKIYCECQRLVENWKKSQEQNL